MTTSCSKVDGKDTVQRHSRVRRLVKIVGPWRVGVSLLFGVVATVLVAWWIALGPKVLPYFPFSRPVDNRGTDFGIPHEWIAVGQYLVSRRDDKVVVSTWIDYGAQIFADTEIYDTTEFEDMVSTEWWIHEEVASNPGWLYGFSVRSREAGSRSMKQISEWAFGWPLPSLVSRCVTFEDGTESWSGVLDFPQSWRNTLQVDHGAGLPTALYPLGFAVNVVLAGTVSYAMLSILPIAFGVRRRLTNRCHPCGYRLDGLIGDTCPECGWRIKRKRAAVPKTAVTDS